MGTVHCRMLTYQYLGLWATCIVCMTIVNINKAQANPVIADEDFLRAAYYDDLSPAVYNDDMDDIRLVDKRSRQRQAGFSSWAGKRGGRNTQGFSSWAGKRAPFNAWAGKRSGGPIYHELEYESLIHLKKRKDHYYYSQN